MSDAPRLLRLAKVQERIGGLHKTSIYRLIRAGEFPKPVKLGAVAVAWRADEIDKWINDRPRAA